MNPSRLLLSAAAHSPILMKNLIQELYAKIGSAPFVKYAMENPGGMTVDCRTEV